MPLQWSDEANTAPMQGLHSPSLHTQRQLKEFLYNQIVDYFDQGKVSAAAHPSSRPGTPSPCPVGGSWAVPGLTRLLGHHWPLH